ncbi:flagellar biosynthesis protein [Tabrizicola sp.]|uniref:flagellar biosynthesis protein n=1 Tax=Tabrizicola sp. TaxID=2005166 RepID=UPI00273732FC|nr:flagellar biosynthesis protein [Tabrizicola sp.]MDP3193983.1 flagellar biosynthesis protein [Tabrizicola sp.]
MSALRLEVFDTASAADGSVQPLVEAAAVEEAKVASFEQGYSAGWDDAVAAQQGDQGRIRADLARNLQSLSFTFQDARSHVLHSIKPLILEMVNRLLPEVARESLAPTVLEAVMPMAEELADAPMILVLNPAVRGQIEDLLSQATGLPMVVEEEPTMPDGQVYIRFGASETKVDLGQVTTDIAIAVRAFFNLNS